MYLLPLDKFYTLISVSPKDFQIKLSLLSQNEFDDDIPFSFGKASKYSVAKSKTELKVNRRVRYMNFMRPTGTIRIKGSGEEYFMELVLKPMIPGQLFLFGLAMLVIYMVSSSFGTSHFLTISLVGLFFFTVGYFFSLFAFNMESKIMKRDILNYLQNNNLI